MSSTNEPLGRVAPELEAEVDRLIDTRGGRELLHAQYDEAARPIVEGLIWQSAGATAAYAVRTSAGRIIVNTGMGFEAHHHKALFDAVAPGPTTHILTTQAHVDHVGGVSVFREPGAVYVAQAHNTACQRDDERIQAFRMSSAMIWFPNVPVAVRDLLAKYPGVRIEQDRPVPDITFDDRMELRSGDLEVELIAAAGETIDSMIVWLPQHRIAMISNLLGPLFPHFPNFNTLRGDRYRFVEPYLASVRRLRDLQPEMLVVGRHTPIRGAALIDASLRRLHDAVDHVHRETLAGINAGRGIDELAREITLPPELRVGQGYGKVAWGVRTIWESYIGWFRLRSTTELYPVSPTAAIADLAAALGPDAVLDRAEQQLAAGEAVTALHLLEGLLGAGAAEALVAPLMVRAHEHLLATGGDVSFWEQGWLADQAARWRKVADA